MGDLSKSFSKRLASHGFPMQQCLHCRKSYAGARSLVWLPGWKPPMRKSWLPHAATHTSRYVLHRFTSMPDNKRSWCKTILWHSYLPQIFTATFNHNQFYELCRSRLRFVITPRALYLQPSSGLSKPKELDQTWPKGPILILAWPSYAEDMNYISWITCSIPPHTQLITTKNKAMSVMAPPKRPSLHVLTRPRCRNLSARWFREQGMEISKIFLAARLGDNVALFLMPEQQCTNDLLHTFYYWNYVCMYVWMNEWKNEWMNEWMN